MSTPVTPEIGAPDAGQPGLSEIQRLTGVFTAPSATFPDLKRNSSWFAPFLLFIVVYCGFVFVVGKKIGWEQVVENKFAAMSDKQKERMAQAPPDVQAKQQQGMVIGYKYGSYIIGPVLVLIVYMVFAGIYMASLNFGMGAEVTFKHALAVVNYAALPSSLIRFVLGMGMPFILKDPTQFNFENPVVTNAGFLVSQSGHPALYALAASVDILRIWSCYLTGVGFAAVSGKKLSSCLVVVFGWYAVFTLIGVGIAAMFA